MQGMQMGPPQMGSGLPLGRSHSDSYLNQMGSSNSSQRYPMMNQGP
jgi:hypothetical protein